MSMPGKRLRRYSEARELLGKASRFPFLHIKPILAKYLIGQISYFHFTLIKSAGARPRHVRADGGVSPQQENLNI